ncbi:MAG: protein-disulfide reductase DsbD [Methylococcales bacterium]
MCRVVRLVLLYALLLWTSAAFAGDDQQLLSVDQAFPFSATIEQSDGQSNTLIVEWKIADGYYLYQKKFSFKSPLASVHFGDPVYPDSKIMQDEFFGEVKIHRGLTQVRIPVSMDVAAPSRLELDIGFQGCADIGICYPPQTERITVDWPKTSEPPAASAPQGNPFSNAFAKLGISRNQSSEQELLPADEAFQLLAEVVDSNRIRLSWRIAPEYYLYRQKFAVQSQTPGISLASYDIPTGKPKLDAEFGQVQVFYDEVAFDVPLLRSSVEPLELDLEVAYQGCAELGVCYPPIKKTVSLQLSQGNITNQSALVEPVSTVQPDLLSEQDQIAKALQNDNLWWTGLLFLGFGLILAFTPCCFPMIPILAGIIVGQGEKINTWHAFWLSLSYVLGSAVTYTIFGVLAGLFGSNLQAVFQNPWLLGSFSAVFVILALSMFGLFELQLPSSFQSRLNAFSNKQQSGSFIGAAVMGMLSALIVGPCVAAPLAGALIYIGQTGDAVIGGFALFMMAIGMGLPLLAVGTSAGKLLPRAGAWMGRAKIVFGFIMLGVAIWLLERILPSAVILLMWAALLISSGVYLGALDALDVASSGYRRFFKSVGIVIFAWGVLSLIGAASGARDIFQPLQGLSLGSGDSVKQSALNFQMVSSEAELDDKIAQATQQGRWVMLDYYADWCISCKEMERDTFADAGVKQALSQFVLLKADVTKNNADDKALLSRFGLIGPPATLFFGPDQQERKAFRIVGYKDAAEFIAHLQTVLKS